MCLFSFFSPVCPPPDLELNEPTSSTLLQGQYPLCLLFSSPSPQSKSPHPLPCLHPHSIPDVHFLIFIAVTLLRMWQSMVIKGGSWELAKCHGSLFLCPFLAHIVLEG